MTLLLAFLAWPLLGLLTIFFCACWANYCPNSPIDTDDYESLLGFGFVWPLFWVAVVVRVFKRQFLPRYRRFKHEAEGWFYRTFCYA